MIILCEKCKKEFDSNSCEQIRKSTRVIIKCPECGKKYDLFMQDNKNYTTLDNGQIVRKNKKIKMSKKKRLEIRRKNKLET
jgi:hydrogenase maturation factor HypF (carbamoyltransferase family)